MEWGTVRNGHRLQAAHDLHDIVGPALGREHVQSDAPLLGGSSFRKEFEKLTGAAEKHQLQVGCLSFKKAFTPAWTPF